ncbi:sigma-70-like protein [Nonomuraea polychroma]|uniref:Sigma-70-like protein n=1 Tax=Nonomuraea polychroma TaxID=46176 RepID=A0A438M801_9ACTN|nr:sigma-70-like protein [Nonomuraea polychroma]
MVEQDWLSERFAEHQDRLHAVAYRMLGSPGEAEDAVQEAWLRVSRADTGQVENPAPGTRRCWPIRSVSR